MNSEIFLVDANSLITPYKAFYPFDFAPGFWKQMKSHIQNGGIAILDKVEKEICFAKQNKDTLQEWFETLNIANYIDHREAAIVSLYASVLQHLQSNPCYKPEALAEWSRDSVADAWLIAAAAVHGCTLITFETFNKGLNSNSPSKRAKIPNIASDFNVKTGNLYDLMKTLEFKLL